MNATKLLIIIGLLLFKYSTSQNHFLLLESNNPKNTDIARVFAPNILSTDLNDCKLTINNKGDELVYSITSPPYKFSVLLSMRFDGNQWSNPYVLPFSGLFKDSDPYLSPNGAYLFFSSNRPIKGNSPNKDFNIWYSKKENDVWTEPKPLDEIINTTNYEYCPAVANNGNLYFCSDKPSGIGDSDIYFSELKNGVYSEPRCLPEPINSKQSEESPYIAPDESFIIYKSYREEDFGNGDIYISYKDPSKGWTNPLNLGEKVNSKNFDSSPFMSSNFEYLFFVSNRIEPYDMPENALKSTQDVYNFLRSYNNGRTNIYIVKTAHVEVLKTLKSK